MIFRLSFLFFFFISSITIGREYSVSIRNDSVKKDSVPPSFPGGIDKFYEYLKTNTKFPIASRLKGVEGKVILMFDVDSAGQVANVRIKKGLDKHTNREALRVIGKSPKWIPGVVKGKNAGFFYTIPLSFQDTISMKGAEVMVNGDLLRNYRELDKWDVNNMPFQIISTDLARAIFGTKFNKKLLVLNDTSINFKGHSEAHFKTTFRLLQNIDTSKVQLNVSEKISSINTWRDYLNEDSVVNIFINPAPAFKTRDKNKLGTITLMTKAGYDLQKRMKDDLLQSIKDFRTGVSPVRKELVVIDEYSYNSSAIFSKMDASVIQSVNVLSSAEAVKSFGNAYSNGIIYIYTKRYYSDKLNIDKQKLMKLIAQYKQDKVVPLNHIIFINNMNIVDFNALSQLPMSDITTVNIISKEEAQAFFGEHERSGIIYVHTAPSSAN